jgi:hypothetical protein
MDHGQGLHTEQEAEDSDAVHADIIDDQGCDEQQPCDDSEFRGDAQRESTQIIAYHNDDGQVQHVEGESALLG